MTIEVFADVACPWCYIGERRLYRALSVRPEIAATVRWRPFRLQPTMPSGGISWHLFAAQKFGSLEHARAVFEQVGAVGRAEGIAFDFEGMPVAPETSDAHALILLAQNSDIPHWPIAESLFRALFEQGRDITEPDVLISIGRGHGLEQSRIVQWLSDDQARSEISLSERRAARLGVTGVPHLLFDGRVSLSGAGSVDGLLRLIDRLSTAEV